jgi:hypothetical protein
MAKVIIDGVTYVPKEDKSKESLREIEKLKNLKSAMKDAYGLADRYLGTCDGINCSGVSCGSDRCYLLRIDKRIEQLGG